MDLLEQVKQGLSVVTESIVETLSTASGWLGMTAETINAAPTPKRSYKRLQRMNPAERKAYARARTREARR